MKFKVGYPLLLVFMCMAVSCTVLQQQGVDQFLPGARGATSSSDQPIAKLTLAPIDGITQLKKNKLLVLDLINNSQDFIRFRPDFGIKVFVLVNNSWVPVPNNYGYPSEDILLPPKGKEDSDAFVPLYPIVDTSSLPVRIRLTVTGTIYSGNEATSTQVSAETELTLQP